MKFQVISPILVSFAATITLIATFIGFTQILSADITYLDLISVSLLLFLIVTTSAITRIYWYKVTIITYVATLITLISLLLLLIIFPLMRISLPIASLFAFWITAVATTATTVSLLLANIKVESLKYISLGLLVFVFIVDSLFLVIIQQGTPLLTYMFITALILEILVLMFIHKEPLYFFNSLGVVSVFSISPFLFIVLYKQILVPLVLTVIYGYVELFYVYNQLKKKIEWDIVYKLKKNINYSETPSLLEFNIAQVFDSQFLYDLYMFGDKLTNALFRFIDGTIEWNTSETYIDGILKVPVYKWTEKIKNYFTWNQSVSIKVKDLLQKIGINIYQFELAIDYFYPYIIISEDKKMLYFFAEDDRKVFTDPSAAAPAIQKLLDFCPEPRFIKYTLNLGGKKILSQVLIWMLIKMREQKLSKKTVIDILMDTDTIYPFDAQTLARALKNKGLRGYIQALKDLGITTVNDIRLQ